MALVLNITLLGYTAGQGQSYGNIWTIYKGNCGYIKWLDRGLHLVINVLGIIILAAVSAFLILLSSPTREDLNSVHEHGKWLEIGIPSFRNFFQVTGTQKALLIALSLASLPLHILYVYTHFPQEEVLILFIRYNSIMFVQISSTWFTWMLVTADFLGGDNFNATYLPPSCFSALSEAFPPALSKVLSMHAQVPNYTKLNPVDCLKVYSDLYPTTFSDVIMVSGDSNSTNSLLAWDTSLNFDTAQWLCSGPRYCGGYDNSLSTFACDFSQLEKNPSSWTNFGHPVQYCLAQPENEPCRLLLEPRLTILMIVANILILVVMVVSLTCYWHKLKHTLTCFGDVLASYLSSEESISDGMCLADKQHIDSYWASRGRAVHLDSGKRKWQSIMSLRRHRILLGLFFIGLLACTICLSYALYIVASHRHLPISLSGLWQLGFGLNTKTSALLTNLDGSPASLAMISNIPQLFLAIVTLVTNAAFVEMTQADEYVRFLAKRATLRVSTPSGKQRGTYLLGMPYRYAIPILAITSTVHWTISQSIVPVYIDSTSTNPADFFYSVPYTTSDLSFSPLAIVVSVVLAGALVISMLMLGFKRLPPKIPLASSCSLALSAAVHPRGTAAPYAEFLEVKWGMVESGPDIGHCSFTTSNNVTEPPEDIQYI